MQWGGELAEVGKNSLPIGELNAEKIKLLDVPVAKLIPASAVTVAPQVVPPLATEVVAASAVLPVAAAPVAAPVPVHVSVPALLLPTPASAPLPVLKALPTPASMPTPLPSTKAEGKLCMEWGEFSGSDLVRATKALEELKLAERLASRTVEYESGYWVYIPPLPTKALLNKKIEEIKALGIEDYFIVREKRKWNNAISLGIFKTEDAAKKFLALMKKKGIRSAKMDERKHKLKFTVFTLRQVDAGLSSRLNALQKEFASSELKSLPCNK